MADLNRRSILTWAMSILCAPHLLAAPSNTSKIVSAGITPSRNRSRIVIETQNKLRFKHFALHQPERLVIDFENTLQNKILSDLNKNVSSSDAFIKSIRLGQKDANTLRMVVDLKYAANANITAVAPNKNSPYRLQIDLTPSDSGSLNVVSPQNGDATVLKSRPSKGSQSASDDPLMEMLNNRQQPTASPHSSTPEPQTPHRKNSVPVIVIDAGHGGKDPGTSGAIAKEKNITLSVALELEKHLKSKGYVAKLTRNKDVFIPLNTRRKIAQDANADLFISIHANAAESASLRGADIFVWGQGNSERARQLAQKENKADLVDGMSHVGNKDVDAILDDMMQTQTTTDSTRVGNLMLRQLAKFAKPHKSSVENANFAVLRSVNIPSVLVELGFLSNSEEEKLLLSQAFQRQAAYAIADAIGQYFDKAAQ